LGKENRLMRKHENKKCEKRKRLRSLVEHRLHQKGC
jgi:hypothetical protein